MRLIGIGKPHIHFVEAWNDMGSFFCSRFVINIPFKIKDDYFEKLKEFDEFDSFCGGSLRVKQLATRQLMRVPFPPPAPTRLPCVEGVFGFVLRI